MKRTHYCVLAAVVVLLAVSGFAGIASAQSEGTPTATTETADTTYLIEIDANTRVVSSSWKDGTVSFVVEADRRTTLVVTDASIPLQDHEAVDIPRKQQQIPEGKSSITFSVTEPRSAAVTVATARGMVGLSPGTGSLFTGSASWSDVQIAAVSGAASIAVISLFVVIRKVTAQTLESERIA